MNKRKDDGHSDKVIELLRAHDLFAVDSLFCPKRKNMFCTDKKKRYCNATYLQKEKGRRPKKLDYFFISNRWRSCVTNSTTCWAPSVHRFGKLFDHSLLKITWRWRVKKDANAKRKDFKAMNAEDWSRLNETIGKTLEASRPQGYAQNSKGDIDARLKHMNKSIQAGIDTCVPNKKRLSSIKRKVSERTRNLYEARAQKFSSITAQGGTVTPRLRKRWNRKIRDSSLEDYNAWLSEMTEEMERAHKKGDSETIFRIVKIISGQMVAAGSRSPTVDKNGELILDQEKLAKVWCEFLEEKFKATDAEAERDPYEELGPQLVADSLTEQAFVRALKKLKKGKACGPDEIPAEVWLNCEAAARELYQLLKIIWAREYIPPELVRASFIMLYKNKGSVNDPSKYRCLALLPHAYKILSLIMLERIEKECADFLSDWHWQAGFRPERGCRDNILLLRVLFDQAISQGKKLYVTYIDYSAAFDTVSHKFLDTCLKNAGASRKTRAMFRAIYKAAEGTARVRGLDGKHIYSATFKVRRGVVQGDIISPIFFILAMEQLFRVHDKNPTGVPIGNYLQIGTLGYADDVAITSLTLDAQSTRLTSISKGSREDADMHLNRAKTKMMQVQKQQVRKPTIQEIKDIENEYTYECNFCGRRCKTKRGLHIHMASCDRQHGLTDEVFTIEGIDATFGTPECRWYRVQWEGYKGADTWEPERSLVRQGCEDSIKTFWSRSKHSPCEDFIADPDNVWRCWSCGRGYKTASALSAHITRTHSQRQWRCTTAAKDAQTKLYKEEQQKKEKAICEGEEIDNVWQFIYLGSRFQADGDQLADIKARIALATSTAGKMRGVWAAKTVPLSLKMRIYKTGVCSRLIYGSEGWKLTARACAMLNGANSRMVSRITGKSAHEEASKRTLTFDVVASIRARRLQWVGHILRTKSDDEGNHRIRPCGTSTTILKKEIC